MEKVILPENWQEWEIIEKIGSGAFGTVYKARRIVGKQEFISAIKIIRVPGDESEVDEMRRQMDDDLSVKAYFNDLVDGYIREINTMDELKGTSNIVSVEDYCVVEDQDAIGWTIYIRMEYLQSFAKYASVADMTEEEVIKLGIDICSALECCEKLHIVHRDIKPSNIFIAPLGQYKLGDFGEARQLDRTLYSYTSRGTYGYMAPEVYYGKEYGLQADIYSLGIVLYRLMNHNREPFINPYKQLITYGEREEAMKRRMTGEQIPPPETASEPFAKVILKACAYAPNERYLNATEMKQDLLALQNPGKPSDNSETGKDKEQGNGKHAAAKAIIAMIVILCVLTVIGFLVWGRRGQKEENPEEPVPVELSTEEQAKPTAETEAVSERESESEADTEKATESETEDKAETEKETEPESETEDAALAAEGSGAELTVIDISGCASFDFGESDGKAHRNFNKKKLRERLTEEGSDILTEEDIEEIINLMSLESFALDKTGDYLAGDVVTMSFAPDEELQGLLNEKGMELKFTKISKVYQNN